ncbi:hypothetical protein [Kitasatospora sp. NPDC093102]|uniref:hypothetical protein n=1 Tax=Kitasatospora sp. NPDC093102 TaxID=3155069 RepID=UPI003423F9CC
MRKAFHRLKGEPARYADGDEVDVHDVPPKLVARTNFPAPLYDRVGGSSAFVRTPYRLSNGHGFYSRPERREGLHCPKRDGVGTVVQWEKSWIAGNDTDSKVFLCFDGRYFIDQEYLTWADGERSRPRTRRSDSAVRGGWGGWRDRRCAVARKCLDRQSHPVKPWARSVLIAWLSGVPRPPGMR